MAGLLATAYNNVMLKCQAWMWRATLGDEECNNKGGNVEWLQHQLTLSETEGWRDRKARTFGRKSSCLDKDLKTSEKGGLH